MKKQLVRQQIQTYGSKDAVIAAALELLADRLANRRGAALNSPSGVRDYLRLSLAQLEYEVFWVIMLDAQNRVIASEEMFRGTLTQTSVYPREVVKRALHYNAGAVIFAHNHPSGAAEPSHADETLTQALKTGTGTCRRARARSFHYCRYCRALICRAGAAMMNQSTKCEVLRALQTLRSFIGASQLGAIRYGCRGEEKQFFFDKVVKLAALIASMPKTYEQDGLGDQAAVYLHYFKGGMDWYITEKDMGTPEETEQHQAYGLADFGDGGELAISRSLN